jgi:uncharacterized membrane protein YdjX (TVP38/TMEM64 family)
MQAPAMFGDFEITPRKITVGVLVILGLVGLTFLYRLIDVQAIHQWAEGVNGFVVFSLVTILPMLGFPVSVAHAVAGVRFGIGLGLGLVAISIVLQMLASYALVKAMPKLFAKRFDSLRKKLPQGAHRSVTLFTMLFPGAPYFAQNYVLPVVGVPLSTYMLWGVPIHIVKSTVGILFGDMSDHLTPLRVAGFVTYTVITTVVCAWAFRRLRAQMKDQQSTAGGRKRRA